MVRSPKGIEITINSGHAHTKGPLTPVHILIYLADQHMFLSMISAAIVVIPLPFAPVLVPCVGAVCILSSTVATVRNPPFEGAEAVTPISRALFVRILW
jgi:hypothetical protein